MAPPYVHARAPSPYVHTPSPVFPYGGLKSTAGWDIQPPTSSLPYSPADFDYCYRPHDVFVQDCAHARQCEERFADLEARMVSLDEYCRRSQQCRCGRSTWCRTKSLLGSLKSRAKSLTFRRKSQHSSDKSFGHVSEWLSELPPGDVHISELARRSGYSMVSPYQATGTKEKQKGRELEWPSDSHPVSSIENLPAPRQPVELPLNEALLISELDSREVDCVPTVSSRYRNPGPGAYPSPTMLRTNHFGYGQAGPEFYDTMPVSRAAMAGQQQYYGAPDVFELPARPLDLTPDIASACSNTSGKSFSEISPMSQSTASATLTTGSHGTVSSQPSISTVSTSHSTARTLVDDGRPLCADQITESPVECHAIALHNQYPVIETRRFGGSPTAVAKRSAVTAQPFLETTRLEESSPWNTRPPNGGVMQTSLYSMPCLLGHPCGGMEPIIHPLAIGAGGQQNPADLNVPLPVTAPTITSSSHWIGLDNLRNAFSRLRRNPEWRGISVMSLSEYDDVSALLAGIDELRGLRESGTGDDVLPMFCLAYLALAMADEMGSAISAAGRDILHREMTKFVSSDAQHGLPECFIEVSYKFLYALDEQLNASPGWWHTLPEKRPTIRALCVMKSHFLSALRSRPRLPPLITPAPRRSWDSTASTALDVVSSDEIRSAESTSDESANDSPNPIPNHAVDDLPSQQRAADKRQTGLTRGARPPSVLSCRACGFRARQGADQRKKLERHNNTDRHRRVMGQDPAQKFPCSVSGCESVFNRRDNMRQHEAKRHGLRRSAEDTRKRKRARRAARAVAASQQRV